MNKTPASNPAAGNVGQVGKDSVKAAEHDYETLITFSNK
jgi:hypothetical protein